MLDKRYSALVAVKPRAVAYPVPRSSSDGKGLSQSALRRATSSTSDHVHIIEAVKVALATNIAYIMNALSSHPFTANRSYFEDVVYRGNGSLL